MKKTALTFVAVAFGTCVAFAQTTPTEDQQKNTETQQGVTIDRMSDTSEEDMAGRRVIQKEELPQAILDKLQSDEFDDWKVAYVSVLDASAIQRLSNTEGVETEVDAEVEGDGEVEAEVTTEVPATEGELTSEAGMQYEVVLVPEDVKEEGAEAKEEIENEIEDAVEEGELNQDSEAGVKVPGIVVRFDEQGNVLSRTEQSEVDLNKHKKEKADY